jgi:GNAT superfamily N-acetyltransferase
MGTLTDRRFDVRAAEPSDRPAVLELLSASLGWSPDRRFDALFSWKHEDNPIGRSPAWVAVDGEAVVGFRTFMRWEHRAASGEVLQAVRAVDTATHPAYQGRGIFRRLTLEALDALRAEGVAFVFNTPNEKSLPGYLKMGWTQVGRLPISVRIMSPSFFARMVRARTPADLWPVASAGGRPAADVLAGAGLAQLLGSLPPPHRLSTHRTPDYLRWRYSFPPLGYRAITAGDDVSGGVAVFRLRQRGSALECVLCEVLSPGGDPGAQHALVRSVVRRSGADYAIKLGGSSVGRGGFVRLPGQGPVLTWRPLASATHGGRLDAWALTLGDIELF